MAKNVHTVEKICRNKHARMMKFEIDTLEISCGHGLNEQQNWMDLYRSPDLIKLKISKST